MRALLASVLVLILSLPTYAATTSPGSPVNYDQVCGGVNVQSPPQTTTQQLQQYCQAADSARGGSTADSSLWKVWAAVAGVCAIACGSIVSSFGGVCTGAALGATATSSAVENNYSSSLQSLGTTGTGAVLTSAGASSTTKTLSACTTAATSAVQAFTHSNSASNDTSVESSNLGNASQLASNTNTTQIAASSVTGATAGANPSQTGSAVPGENFSCTTARNSGSGQAILECAIANDPSLKGLAADDFQKAFQQATGQDLNSFLQNATSPASAIASAAGGSYNSTDSATIAQALQDMQNGLGGALSPANPLLKGLAPGTAYAAAGGGHAANGSDELDFNSVLSNVMGMFGGQAASKGSSGANALNFGRGANRFPAGLGIGDTPEDKTISLFQRVSYRYNLLGKRFHAPRGNRNSMKITKTCAFAFGLALDLAFASALLLAPLSNARAANLEKVLPPLDTLAAAVCTNACSAPVIPFHGAVLLTACQEAIGTAGGYQTLTALAAKSKELSAAIDEALGGLGIRDGLQALQRVEAKDEKRLSCGAGVLFALMAGARKPTSKAKPADFSCIHGGLTDGGCSFADAQIASATDSKILFRSGLDRALASFYDRLDAGILAKKLDSSIKKPKAALEYLSSVQSGSLSPQLAKLVEWAREHPSDILIPPEQPASPSAH